MKENKSKPRWKTYEHQVFELFKEHFPTAKVRRNVHVRGRFSKRKRQIDVLITEATPSGVLKTVVETKCFNRKVDVKAVDGLAGFVDDVGAQRGILITNHGCTLAALRRAYYGPNDLELDVLNFSASQRFQGFCAVPYAGKNSFLVPAPFGWIIDATRGEGFLASIYQRGLDLPGAKKKKEFIYINFWDRTRDPLTSCQLDEAQVAHMSSLSEVTVSHRPTVQRSDVPTRLRIAEVKKYKCLEVTGFLEFDDVIFFAVLLTPLEMQRANIRRLESVLKQAQRIHLRRDNTGVIARIRERLKDVSSASERAHLLCEIGHWYRDMDEFEEALKTLEESLALDDTANAYYTIKELLPVLEKLGDPKRAKEVMSLLLRLDPHNPTVFNDCFTYASGWIETKDLLHLFDTLRAELSTDLSVQANCDFYAGTCLTQENPAMAKQRFIAAQKIFRATLPKNHEVFRALRAALRQLP